jgi:hypothetical protein
MLSWLIKRLYGYQHPNSNYIYLKNKFIKEYLFYCIYLFKISICMSLSKSHSLYPGLVYLFISFCL